MTGFGITSSEQTDDVWNFGSLSREEPTMMIGWVPSQCCCRWTCGRALTV